MNGPAVQRRGVHSPLTLHLKVPPDCVDVLKYDLPSLRVGLNIIRRQLDSLRSELFIIRVLHASPSPEIAAFFQKEFPDLAHVFDLSPDQRKTQEDAILYLKDIDEVRLAYFRVMIEHLGERNGKAPPPESPVVGEPDASVE
ncbi:hypothetical protein SLS64_013468 [Diaporthe eres]|uniref:Uncharacterized protein n=1 Tax=Diaporthe eres TaxID=83184 RepID=A0ABR1PID8_DIAER